MNKIFTHKTIELPSLEYYSEDGLRWYKTPGNLIYPSVSSLMGSLSKDSIQAWKEKVGEKEANKISKYASDFGTNIHSIIEDYLNNKPIPLDNINPLEKWSFMALQKYLDKIDNIYCQEATLFSDVLKLGGRTDCIAEYEGEPSVIDFKTARKLKEESWIESYFLQATCYSIMFEEMTSVKVPQIVILMTTDEGEAKSFKKKRKDYYKRLGEVLIEFRRNQRSDKA